MKKNSSSLIVLLLAITALSACSSSDSHQDLRDFIEENKRRPPGNIKAPPKIEPYESYSYDAYRLRSPFDRPVSAIVQKQILASSDNVKPDFARQKERLEQFDLSALFMVGSLTKSGTLWALVSDSEGSIERVKTGNYIGRNHGRVIGLNGEKIDLLEIVASGDGWLERPNVLQLKTAEEK
jgi:type IV pilus assembly protein PilP